jgi:hypothetical protein
MSNIERRIRLGVIAGVSVLFALAVVVLTVDVAKATPAQPEPVCATWKINGVGGEPEGSSIDSASKATLVKPEGENSGVELVANDLDLTAGADELVVSVEYSLVDGSTAATAVRLFGYAAQGVDPASPSAGAPDYGPDIAEAESGTMTLTIPAGQSLGTLGVTYDASNTSHGTLTVQDMAVDERPVSFTECPEPTPSPTVTTPAATTPPATAPPTVEPSATVPPVVGGPSLPVTGVNVWTLGGAGLVLIALGVAVWGLFRPKRVRTMI